MENRTKKRIAIIGAGAAGLSLAWKLINRNHPDLEIKIIEKEPVVGGIAAGFEHQDLIFNYGSHKLAASTPPEILADIRSFLGSDLLTRQSHSCVQHMGSQSFLPVGSAPLFKRLFPKKTPRAPLSYPAALNACFGKKLCRTFYFPYMEKLIGLELDTIAAPQLAGNEPLLPQDFPLNNAKPANNYFFPKYGFMQLFEEMMKAVWKKGGRFLLMQKFIRLSRSSDDRLTCILEDGARIDFDHVFSTISLPHLVQSINQIFPENVTEVIRNPLEVPDNVLAAVKGLRYRGLLLCYLILNTNQFSLADTYYFPDPAVLFSRVSEPKHFNASLIPHGKTGLCVEIPCGVNDTLWRASDEELIRKVTAQLDKVGLPVGKLVIDSMVKRMEYAYPVYDADNNHRLRMINNWLDTIPNLTALSREGLYTWDSIPQTMLAGYHAAACLDDNFRWDSRRWRGSTG